MPSYPHPYSQLRKPIVWSGKLELSFYLDIRDALKLESQKKTENNLRLLNRVQNSFGSQLPGELRHLWREVDQIELLHPHDTRPCILRRPKQIVATGLQDLETERRVAKRVGGVRLTIGIGLQTPSRTS